MELLQGNMSCIKYWQRSIFTVECKLMNLNNIPWKRCKQVETVSYYHKCYSKQESYTFTASVVLNSTSNFQRVSAH